uniref:Secreted protein n=1 Tax=Chrysotila carterae TaxID=13221 RepID=A0A7S4ETT8_CHRCT
MSSIAFLSASIFFFCAKLPSSSSESTSFFPLAFLLTTFFCDLLLPSPAPLIGSSLREGVHALASTDGSSCRDYLSCAFKAHDRNVRPKKWFLLNEICQHIRHAIRL